MPKLAWIFFVSLVAARLLILPFAVAAQEMAPEPSLATLEVIGRAGVVVQPDMASIAFSVESSDRQAAKAVADNARRAEALLEALRSLMNDDDTLQTASLNLQPVYDKDDRLRPSGYRASNRVTLETRQLDRIGAFIDAAAASGAGQISSLQFRSSREADHRTEAAVLAVDRARDNASRLAQAAGVSLGRVLKMRYAPQGPPGIFLEKATLAMGRTPVEIGDLIVEAEVLMIFEIH